MASEVWIERSLERLEWLEGQRAALAAVGTDTETLAEYDTEIAALYEVLEAAAERDDDGLEAASMSPADAAAPVPVGVAEDTPRPVRVRDPDPGVFEESAGVPAPWSGDQDTLTFIEQVGWTTLRDLAPIPDPLVTNNLGAQLQTQATPSDAFDSIVDDEWGGPSARWRWLLPVAAAMLIFVGLGAYLGVQPSEAVASAPTDQDAERSIAAASERIEAAETPEDTQEPEVARGAVVDRPPPSELEKPSSEAARSKAKRRAKGKRKRRRPDRNSRTNRRRIELGSSREPLAGL